MSHRAWGWIHPIKDSPPLSDVKAAYVPGQTTSLRSVLDFEIEIRTNCNLEVEEVLEALMVLDAVDADVIDVQEGRLDTIEHMIICTGRSRAHLQRIAQVIVRALKRRKLVHAPGATGADGEDDDDDWIAVDCGNIMVHMLTADTRQHLGLEELWRNPEVSRVFFCSSPLICFLMRRIFRVPGTSGRDARTWLK